MRHSVRLRALQWGGARARSSTIAKRKSRKKSTFSGVDLSLIFETSIYNFSDILSSLID